MKKYSKINDTGISENSKFKMLQTFDQSKSPMIRILGNEFKEDPLKVAIKSAKEILQDNGYKKIVLTKLSEERAQKQYVLLFEVKYPFLARFKFISNNTNGKIVSFSKYYRNYLAIE